MPPFRSFSMLGNDAKEIGGTFKRWHNTGLWFLVVVVFVALTGWFAYCADHEMRNALLVEATIAARSINTDDLKKLEGSDQDLITDEYNRFKAQLTSMRGANAKYRFLYLMGQNDKQRIFFFADSEPVESDDYSPPGQIYHEASPVLIATFQNKTPFVEGPIGDEWGTWVSALVPVLDKNTGKVLALFGMDVSADTWRRGIVFALWKPVSFTFLLLICVVTVSDIASRKREERRLRKVNTMLVKETMRANTMAREARDVCAKKSLFTSNIGQQIRGPFEEIMKLANLLSETPLNEEQSRYVSLIQKTGGAATDLLVNVQDLSKIEAGLLVIERKNFYIRDLMQSVESAFRRRARERHLTFSVKVAEDVPLSFVGDAPRIKQVLNNLIDNAIKNTSSGSVEVAVSLISKTTTISTLKFSVRDTGAGLADDTKELVFEKAARAETAPSPKAQGTGLGLAIVKRLIEKMGGSISVNSKAGTGSEFWFTLYLDNGQE